MSRRLSLAAKVTKTYDPGSMSRLMLDIEKRTTVEIDDGTYTPVLTGVTNLAASTAFKCQFSRVGNVVTVCGKVAVDPTTTGATEVGISLPIHSDFGAEEDCAGVACCAAVAFSAAILADATNNRASMKWVAADVANRSMHFTFSYRLI